MKKLSDWLEYIEKKHAAHAGDGLTPVKAAAERLGLLKTDAYVITITGTNGKGSCTEMLTSVYTDAGYSVGTYTSPHLMHFNERIRIQKKPVDESTLCAAFTEIEKACHDISLTYFAFITLAALWIFKKADVQILILEVGLGGRLDATNILDADLAIVTSVGLDHMDYLGHTREAIAQEKAGIFRKNQWIICGEPSPPMTLIQAAEKLSAKIAFLKKDFDFQITDQSWHFKNHTHEFKHSCMPILAPENAAIALQTVITLNHLLPVSLDQAIDTIIHTHLIGRCDVRKIFNGGTILFDVAHNPDAALKLAQFIKKYCAEKKPKKIFALFSMLTDKDIPETLKPLISHIHEWHITQLNTLRAAKKEQLEAAFDLFSIKPFWHENTKKAYYFLENQLDQDYLLVILGSFFLVGECSCFSI